MRFTYLRLLLDRDGEYGEKRKEEGRVELEEEEGTRSTSMNSGLRIISCGHSPVQQRLEAPWTTHHLIPRTHTDQTLRKHDTTRSPCSHTPPLLSVPPVRRPAMEEGAGRGVGCVRARWAREGQHSNPTATGASIAGRGGPIFPIQYRVRGRV